MLLKADCIGRYERTILAGLPYSSVYLGRLVRRVYYVQNVAFPVGAAQCSCGHTFTSKFVSKSVFCHNVKIPQNHLPAYCSCFVF
jgi:hypothetical protein